MMHPNKEMETVDQHKVISHDSEDLLLSGLYVALEEIDYSNSLIDKLCIINEDQAPFL